MEDNVTEEQSCQGTHCLQYKLHKNINEHQQTMEADEKWLNDGSLENYKAKLCKMYNINLNLNCAYVCFVKHMCQSACS